MRRSVAHTVFVTLLSTLATVLGVVTAMTATGPGRDLLARIASAELASILRGRLVVGEISGSFLRSLVLDGGHEIWTEVSENMVGNAGNSLLSLGLILLASLVLGSWIVSRRQYLLTA